jgi:predicted HAD superfamily phosphohydrolase YqeG
VVPLFKLRSKRENKKSLIFDLDETLVKCLYLPKEEDQKAQMDIKGWHMIKIKLSK